MRIFSEFLWFKEEKILLLALCCLVAIVFGLYEFNLWLGLFLYLVVATVVTLVRGVQVNQRLSSHLKECDPQLWSELAIFATADAGREQFHPFYAAFKSKRIESVEDEEMSELLRKFWGWMGLLMIGATGVFFLLCAAMFHDITSH